MDKYSYILESKEPSKYPNIEGLCSSKRVSDEDKEVYILGDTKKIYYIRYKGVNKWICVNDLPSYGLASDLKFDMPQVSQRVEKKEYTIEKIFRVKKCNTTNIFKNVKIKGGKLSFGDFVKVFENDDSWHIEEEVNSFTEEWTYKQIFCSCDEAINSEKKYHLRSCYGENKNATILGGAVKIGQTITVCENPDTWEVIEEVLKSQVVFNLTAKVEDCNTCDEAGGVSGNCTEDGERTIAWATIVKLPEPSIPDKGFKECCYENIVLADMEDDDPYKNDFTGFYFQKQTGSDSCDFILHDLGSGDTYDLNNETYGVFKPFKTIEGNLTLTTFIVEWKKVLRVLGEGVYRVEKDTKTAGFKNSIMSNTFKLKKFSNERADKTVRIEGVMTGRLEHKNTNFKNSDFKTSLRTMGFFGRREPKYKQDNLIKRNFESVQITMTQENEYKYQTNLIPSCISDEILDFILFSNRISISDYNTNNHTYIYRMWEVDFKGNKGNGYSSLNRDVELNLTFTDRIKNRRKSNC